VSEARAGQLVFVVAMKIEAYRAYPSSAAADFGLVDPARFIAEADSRSP
jgi:hypothetical protein